MSRGSATATGDPVTGSPGYPLGSRVNAEGHVEVGGCDLVEVAREFGTPAYVYAPDDIRARARAYVEALGARGVDSEVLFASKAAPFTAVYRICREEGLSVDVASGGELHMALAAGFEPERIYMHGNNKSAAELRMAFDAGVGCIVVDSLDEIDRADCARRSRPGRADPAHARDQALDALLHPDRARSTRSSASGSRAGRRRRRSPRSAASGTCGSPASTPTSARRSSSSSPTPAAIEVMADFCRPHRPRVMNVGGGLGIAYSAADRPPSIEDYVDLKVDAVAEFFDPLPKILLEPGRSLVGNAGVTLYTVGTVKEIPGVRTYVAVDGGMSDNLRPMLYGSRYEALIADRADAPGTVTSTVAGKHCESGDILVRDVELADPRPGDVLVTPATGAYGYAMANNYNGIPRPPVIFCSDGARRARRPPRDLRGSGRARCLSRGR